MPSALDIARHAKLRPIEEIAAAMGIGRHLLEHHGEFVAKIRLDAVEERGRSVVGIETGDDAMDVGRVALRASGQNAGDCADCFAKHALPPVLRCDHSCLPKPIFAT